MNKLEKYLTIKWGVPCNSAAKLEVLANNYWHLVTSKKELKELVRQCVYPDIPDFKVYDVVDTIMQKPPFNTFGDRRYQLFINGLLLMPRLSWTHNPLNTDEDDKDYYGYHELYYNWYNTKEEAKEKFKQKLEWYTDEYKESKRFDCWPMHHFIIYLIDSETDEILDKSMVFVDGFDIKKYPNIKTIK